MIRWAQCRHNFLFRVTVLIPALAILTFGQVPTGSLGGTVLDESEAVIPDAKVTVTNQDTAFQRLVTSGKDGMFLVPGLPAGPYEVRAEAKGFRTLIQTTTVRTGNSSRVELLLPIGVLQQLVEAIDRIPPLDYDKHGIAGVVSRFQIENLPLNGREFLRLAVLEPGVTAAPSAGYFSRQFDVSVMSGPAERTRTTMDGGPIYGPATGGTPQNFSQEVVREFQISTVNFDLSTGLTGSGAINVATRYGGNDYHGSGFFFFRDHNMAAYPALRREPTNQDPFFARRQAGFHFGGPLKKDRLFFSPPSSISIRTAPSQSNPGPRNFRVWAESFQATSQETKSQRALMPGSMRRTPSFYAIRMTATTALSQEREPAASHRIGV